MSANEEQVQVPVQMGVVKKKEKIKNVTMQINTEASQICTEAKQNSTEAKQINTESMTTIRLSSKYSFSFLYQPSSTTWSDLDMYLDEPSEPINVKRSFSIGRGEICITYIEQSDSSLFRHPHYKYPAIIDPGIESAILASESEIIYGEDGRALYLAICREINQCPVRLFYESLNKKEIDLSYYGVNPMGILTMAIALELNQDVCVFNLTENFLNDHACFHLGDLLTKNCTLVELNLSGCRIGPSGVRSLVQGLLKNQSLQILNLNSNELGDEGGVILAKAIDNGVTLKDLYLSYNRLGSEAAAALARGFELSNTINKIDLSWNILCSPDTSGTCALLKTMQHNENLEWLDLSWNAINGQEIAVSLKRAMSAPKLSYLNLSNNKIDDTAIQYVATMISKAKNLVTLNLSNNPITPAGAINLISRLKFRGSGIKNLLLENVPVDDQFIENLKYIKRLKFRRKLNVTTGYHTKTFKTRDPDIKGILLNRMHVICMESKSRVNFALLILQLAKDVGNNVDAEAFRSYLAAAGVAADKDLIAQFVEAFPGPINNKERTLDLDMFVEHIKRKWPEKKLPPEPPSSRSSVERKGKLMLSPTVGAAGDAPPLKKRKVIK